MWLARLFSRRASSVNSTSFGLSSTSKISTPFSCIESGITISLCVSCIEMVIWIFWWGRIAVQGEVERCTLINRAFGPHAPAMPTNDPLHEGKADSRTFKIFGAVQTLENAKQFIIVGHVEA